MTVPLTPPTLTIPTIDLSPDSGLSDGELAATLLHALNSVGFLHVLNPGPGLSAADVRNVFSISKELFGLPLAEKEKAKFDIGVGCGYTTMMGQLIGKKEGRVRGDIKESFSLGPDITQSIPYPPPQESHVSDLTNFRKACHSAGLRVLDLFGVALKVEDPYSFFRSRHTYGESESLRLLHYPSFRKGAPTTAAQNDKTKWDDIVVLEKDIRAGAHQDFGSETLLFLAPPDETGAPTSVEGLEVFVRREDGPEDCPDGSGKGWWIPAPSPEGVGAGGSMLVNVGTAMEMWSGGKLKATFHRVVFPTPKTEVTAGEDGVLLPGRQSVVCFMIPDSTVLLTPINSDGSISNAEGSKTAGELFKERMAKAYGSGKGPVLDDSKDL